MHGVVVILDPEKHHRRTIRLRGYDYSLPGWYYVTRCTHGRQCLFGTVQRGEMQINEFGTVVEEAWLRSSEIRKEIHLDDFCVMPNHMHAIVIINEIDVTASRPMSAAGSIPVVGATGRSPLQRPCGPARKSLGSLMAGFGSSVTTIINSIRRTPGAKVWQRNYYEHIIRNEDSLERIRFYIQNNPAAWASDKENPAHLGEDDFDSWLSSLHDRPDEDGDSSSRGS